MNYSKLSLFLLVMPFVVMADNPLAPMDKDTASSTTSTDSSQVSAKSESVGTYETSSSYSESQGIEDVIVTATRRETSLMETRLLFLQLLKRSLPNMVSLILKTSVTHCLGYPFRIVLIPLLQSLLCAE